jgi:hypothetical protein
MDDAPELVDPAPEPVEAARHRADDFVRNIATQTKLSLRERRDELDNLMARISASEGTLSAYIGEFARFNFEALAISSEIKERIDHAALPFKGSPPATLTQATERKNGSGTA